MAGDPAASQVFASCTIAFVPSRSLPPKLLAELKKTVQCCGATVLEPEDDGGVAVTRATHIVANTIDFEEYDSALAMMVQVVKASWVMNSFERNKLAQTRPYSPDPRMIFSSVVLTCADIPPTDKEAILGATMALGGMESKDLTRLTTHICALSEKSPKCQQAIDKALKCKLVLPHWFDDCFKLGKLIDETPYLLPDPEILRKRPEDDLEVPSSEHLDGAVSTQPNAPVLDAKSRGGQLTVFRKKKVMLSWDLSISKRFRAIVGDLIKAGGGEIEEQDETKCDMFICKYREGPQYVRAAQCGKDIGNLAWLFYLITKDEWCSPLRRLLHYPVPKDGLPGFKDLRVTLSNYGGEARTYLENLVTAAGATYTKTMKADNTHLVTARDNSEKCDAAKDWNISMVNHLWIEESYARCEVQTVSNPKYTTFPPRTNLGEIIGQTFLEESRLRGLYYPGGEEIMDAAAKKKRKILEAAQENVYSIGEAADVLMEREETEPLEVLRDADEDAPQVAKPSAATRKDREFATPRTRHVRLGKENATPSIMSSGSRSAKDKAKAKLEHLAPDIALYEKEKKRSSKDGHGPWGGKRAADKVDNDRSSANASSPAPEHAEKEEQPKRAAKRQKTSLPPVEMRLTLTLYERWINNPAKEDAEKKKLRNLGIQIVQDNQPCDYLAAPRLARTMKFLKALARGPDVISVRFVDDILDQGKLVPVKKYLLKDKENEKKFGISLQKSVARARANHGRLLANTAIFCTEDIKNGVDSYQAIAEANGAVFKTYRARSGTVIKPTTAEEDGGAAPEPVYLLSCGSPAERALWPKFEKLAEEGHMEPRVVAPDWLLDVAMKQEVDFDDEYLARNFWKPKSS